MKPITTEKPTDKPTDKPANKTAKKKNAVLAPTQTRSGARSDLSASSDNRLVPLRQKINALDEELLRLINQRAQVAQEIGHLKSGGIKYRPEREYEVLRVVQKKNPGPLSDKTVAILFREIMSACLAMEQPLRVTYLGPQGTFSEAAANLHFGHAVHLMPQTTVAQAIREVELGRADFAVVPVENSIEGAVGSTLDLLLTTRLIACGETILPVHHHLLSRALSMKKIKKVAAHPLALGQCQQWLKINLPHVPTIPTVSNAAAAVLAVDDPSLAAIAGDSASDFYRLTKLATNIEDYTHNTTRFLVLGHINVAPTHADKTSIVASARNIPGGLYALMAPLAKEGVSMSRLESRPAPVAQVGGHRLWEYVFFIDFLGHQDEPQVRRALSKMEENSSFLKVLGSYPSSVLAKV